MKLSFRRVLVALAIVGLRASALPFDSASSHDFYDSHYVEKDGWWQEPWGLYIEEPGGDCSQYWLQGQIAGNPALYNLFMRWAGTNPDPKCSAIPKFGDGLARPERMLLGLLNRLKYDVQHYNAGSNPVVGIIPGTQ